MRQQNPMTHTMNITETRRDFSQIVNEVFHGKKRVLVEKSGIPVAAIISPSDLDRLRRYDEQRQADIAAILAVGEAFKDVPAAEIDREVTKALREVRAEDEQQEPNTAAPTR